MPTTTTTEVSTDQLVHELLIAERAIERAEDRSNAIKEQLIERLGVGGKLDHPEAKIAVVESHTKVLDLEALQAVASKGFFYKVTKRVVDMTAFKALDALGVVPVEVTEIVSERVSAPGVRITYKR